MKLSVVIPCYNGAGTIAVQLAALANQHCSEQWEVIVADNGSTDKSVSIVEQYRDKLPNLRIADASARQGQPYALNVGANAAIGDALAFCDADDEVGIGWVAAMSAALSKYDFVACRFDTEKLNPAWIQRGNPQANGIQKIWYPPFLPHAGGGSLGVKRSLHEAIGGFDESLPILHDTDYCWRLQLAGSELHFVPDAVLHVRHRSSLRGIYYQSRGYAEYNILLSKRYRSTGQGISNPWKRYILDWIKSLRMIPKARHRERRAQLAWQFGRQIGRIRGVVKHRVPPV